VGYNKAAKIGDSTQTGNALVSTLPVGAILEVTADGELTIVDLPEAELDLTPGSRINTKYGPSTVVSLTSVASLSASRAYDVLYIADGTNVVRIAATKNVSAL
jgi:hypothetical protein